MPIDLAIVYSPVGGGHKAAAFALAETARACGRTASVVDLFNFAPKFVGDAYVGTHLNWTATAPQSYGDAYHGANHRGGAWEPIRLKWDQLIFGAFLAKIRSLSPRAIVATHHLPLVLLGRERRKSRLDAPVTAVITDYTSHAVWAERGIDAFCVPSLFAEADIVRHGADPSRVFMTGIPVRQAFETMPAVSLKKDERLRVLVTSGGFGVGPMREIVRSFGSQKDVDLTVVCGAAENLKRQLESDVSEMGLRANIVGFESDMPARLRECHLVVGKAGGLTVSETLASGRPMIVVGATPGNEKLNEAFVVGGRAGYAAQANEVGPLSRFMRENGDIERMGARGRLLVVSRASERVLDVALAKPMAVRAA